MKPRLSQDGFWISLGADDGAPQLLMLSSDESNAFKLTFVSSNRVWLSLSGDGIGEVVIDG